MFVECISLVYMRPNNGHQAHITHSLLVFKWLESAEHFPDSKVHVANIGPTWVLSAPGGPPVGPMNLTIRVSLPPSMSLITAHAIARYMIAFVSALPDIVTKDHIHVIYQTFDII